MSKLIKLRLCLILLIIGIGLIPTAFLAKGYFQDQVPANSAKTLLTLKDEAISYIEQEFKGLGIPEILPGLKMDVILDLEDNVTKIEKIPEFLQFIKNETLNSFPLIINGSKTAKEIAGVIAQVITENNTAVSDARNQFFNNFTFQVDYDTPIEGVSEYMLVTLSLNYTTEAQLRLLDGYKYNEIDYPGLIDDLNYGTGVLNWLEFYSLAEANITNNRELMENVYNCSWSSGQLQNLSAYIKSYLWNTIIKDYYDSKGITDPAEFEFFGQWANKSFINARINLDVFSDVINQTLTGLEAGYPNPTDISLFSARLMWDPSYPFSFLNETGFLIWKLIASTDNKTFYWALNVTLGITNVQIDKVNSWLFSTVKNNIVPIIIEFPPPYGYEMTTTEYSEMLLYRQWANGTVIPEGINLRLGYKGFEAGIPIKTNISLKITSELFNEENKSSFITKKGILKWINAFEGNIDSRNELISIFDLSQLQLNLTLKWLFTTLRYNITPFLIWYIVPYTTMTDFAEIEFYRQWANGTIFPEGIDIGPFLSLESPLKNFEIGIPTSTNLNYSQVELLWDENNYNSFDNRKGIFYWYEACVSPNVYNELKSYFNLNEENMDTILNWLVYIRDNLTLRYTQSLYNLPTDYYKLSEWYFMGIFIGAICFISIAIIFSGLVLIYYRKR